MGHGQLAAIEVDLDTVSKGCLVDDNERGCLTRLPRFDPMRRPLIVKKQDGAVRTEARLHGDALAVEASHFFAVRKAVDKNIALPIRARVLFLDGREIQPNTIFRPVIAFAGDHVGKGQAGDGLVAERIETLGRHVGAHGQCGPPGRWLPDF